MSYSRPPGANVKETNLYICNLGPSASEDTLDELFGEFGTIVTRTVLRDRHGRAKGTGFVRFARTEDAALAIKEMNCKSVPGCSAPLEVRVAEEHGKQKSAFFTSFVKRRTQSNAHQHDTSKVTVKREEAEEEEKDHDSYGVEEGGGTCNIWGSRQQNRFNPLGYGVGRGLVGGVQGLHTTNPDQRSRGIMRKNFRRGNFDGGAGGGDYTGKVWDNYTGSVWENSN